MQVIINAIYLSDSSATRLIGPNSVISVLDLTFSSHHLALKVHCKVLYDSFTSDHFQIIMQIRNQISGFKIVYPKKR